MCGRLCKKKAEVSIQLLCMRQAAVTMLQCNQWLLQLSISGGHSLVTFIEKKATSSAQCFGFQQQISDNSDRQLIVGVCPLLIIHAVCLSHSQKTREVLLFRV